MGDGDRTQCAGTLRRALIAVVAALAVLASGAAAVSAAPGDGGSPVSLGSLDPTGPLSPVGAISPGMLRFDLGGWPNPIVRPVAADPSVVRAPDGTFYLYATADDWQDGQGLRHLPIFSSRNLVDWTYVGDTFPARPAWVPGDAGLWAPDVQQVGDRYVMYYSVGYLDPARNPCIGMATATAPTGPFTDLGRPVFCAHDLGVRGTIDPYVDYSTGVPVVFVGNYHGVYAIELTADGTRVAGDDRHDNPTLVAGDGYEAPFVQYRDGYYYLYLSAGNCCSGALSDYRVYVGRSESLTGPYHDAEGRALTEDNAGSRILSGNLSWLGPGHNTVVTDDAGEDWIIYHAAPSSRPQLSPNGPQNRQGMIDRISWTGGWPEIGDGTPSSTAPAVPYLDGVPTPEPPAPEPDPQPTPPSAGSLQSLSMG